MSKILETMENIANYIKTINTVYPFQTRRGKLNSKNEANSRKKQLIELTYKSLLYILP